MKSSEKRVLSLPEGKKKLLLHSCCAPCSCSIIARLKESSIPFNALFYNPNIDTVSEYLKRKDEIQNFCQRRSVQFYDLDYDNDQWLARIKGLEREPEKGRRCSICFDIRMERTALFAHENSFDIITASIGISRYKDFEQVTLSGQKAASKYPDLDYWSINWRKNGGLQEAELIAKKENFYRQNYCGCVFSKR